jgi:hypothetical protein
MPDLFGQRLTRDEIAQRVGRLDQAAGARPLVFDDGPARGMRGIDVWTGSGLEFTVLPDRCLDIGPARFAGMPLAWESSTGPVRPERYEPQGLGWLRSFGGGLVTTCGLRHFGGPEEDGGETFGLHGRASNLAAQDVAIERAWEGDAYAIRLRGRIAEAEVFKPTLVLERTISTALGSRHILLQDRVTNAGHAPSSAMLLYHVNLGWPLLSEHSRLVVNAATVEPRTEHAARGLKAHAAMAAPAPGFEEQVYRMDPRAGAGGLCRAALVNPRLAGGLALILEWPKKALPYLTQWKMMGQGTYVLGIEPCNAPLLARAELRRRGLMPQLGPGESFETSLALRVAVGAEEIRDLEAAFVGRRGGPKQKA